jgi:hypothetical protein
MWALGSTAAAAAQSSTLLCMPYASGRLNTHMLVQHPRARPRFVLGMQRGSLHWQHMPWAVAMCTRSTSVHEHATAATVHLLWHPRHAHTRVHCNEDGHSCKATDGELEKETLPQQQKQVATTRAQQLPCHPWCWSFPDSSAVTPGTCTGAAHTPCAHVKPTLARRAHHTTQYVVAPQTHNTQSASQGTFARAQSPI